MPRVVGAEPPPGELLLEDEVARPGVGLEVEPAPRAEGVGAAQQEARVVVQPREDARIVVAVGLRTKEKRTVLSKRRKEADSRVVAAVPHARTNTSQMTAQTWTG